MGSVYERAMELFDIEDFDLLDHCVDPGNEQHVTKARLDCARTRKQIIGDGVADRPQAEFVSRFLEQFHDPPRPLTLDFIEHYPRKTSIIDQSERSYRKALAKLTVLADDGCSVGQSRVGSRMADADKPSLFRRFRVECERRYLAPKPFAPVRLSILGILSTVSLFTAYLQCARDQTLALPFL